MTSTLEPAWQMALEANFGSVPAWREDFLARAQNSSGAGSVQLCFVPREGRLQNRWLSHDAPGLADALPLLSMPRGGVAALSDSDASAQAYIDPTDWRAVYQRYQQAVHDASEPWAAQADSAAQAMVIDVRRAAVFDKAQTMLPGAQWRDPAQVSSWCDQLPANRALLVYCVYGHEVSRATALRLRAAGLNARYLQGGIDGWQQAGRALVPK